MRITFHMFDKWLFWKVYRYNIVLLYHILVVDHSQNFLQFLRIFLKAPTLCHELSFDLYWWTNYTSALFILEKLISRSSFYDIACFLILASGPYLDDTLLQIIFSEVPVLILLYLIVDHWYECFSGFRGRFQYVHDSA